LILADITAKAAPEPDPDAVPVLASCDYSRLRSLVRLWRHLNDMVGGRLTDVLDRCRVLPPDAVPPTVAVLGARVAFAVEGRIPESVTLVMPEEDLQDGSTLAVSTPFGAALLGAAAGQTVEALQLDGRRMLLHLLAVSHNPGPPLVGAMLPDG
jgi:regulator of nucleoside diphosphate kinase